MKTICRDAGYGISRWSGGGHAAGVVGRSAGVWRGNEDIKRTSNTRVRPFRSYSLSLAVGYGGDQCMSQFMRPPRWSSSRGRHSASEAKLSPSWPSWRSSGHHFAHLDFFNPFPLHFLSSHWRCAGLSYFYLHQKSAAVSIPPVTSFPDSILTRSQLFHYPPCLPWNAQSPSQKSL